MNSISFDLSGKTDPLTIRALRAVKEQADALHIPFFIVGALARDYILTYCYGIKTARMTRDVDMGVEVASLDQVTQLTNSLISTGEFASAPERQRVLFGSVPIDIVPFGPVAGEEKKIGWPPEHEIIMSVAGFEEAYESAMVVRLSSDPVLEIRLPTLPGLALMKIVSWEDRYPERQKDAEDLLLIMDNYEKAGNFDRLYDEENELLEEEDFDPELAGIRLLGRDMATIADRSTATLVRDILDVEADQQSHCRLTIDMIRNVAVFDRNIEKIQRKIQKMREGFVEIVEQKVCSGKS